MLASMKGRFKRVPANRSPSSREARRQKKWIGSAVPQCRRYLSRPAADLPGRRGHRRRRAITGPIFHSSRIDLQQKPRRWGFPDLAIHHLPQIQAASVNFLNPGRAVRSSIGLQKPARANALLSPAGGTMSKTTVLFVCVRVLSCALRMSAHSPVTYIALKYPAPLCDHCGIPMLTVTTILNHRTPQATKAISYQCQTCKLTLGKPKHVIISFSPA
jgi:hypothetical protein